MFRPLNAVRRFTNCNPDVLKKIVARDDLHEFQFIWDSKGFEEKKVLEAVRRDTTCDPILASWTHDYPDWLNGLLRTNQIFKFLEEKVSG